MYQGTQHDDICPKTMMMKSSLWGWRQWAVKVKTVVRKFKAQLLRQLTSLVTDDEINE
jgi:hypothetical protein